MMRMRCATLVALLLVTSACAGHSRPGRTTPAASRSQTPLDTAAILSSARQEIDDANAAWFPALQRRDAAAIAAAYADSGLFIGPDGSVVRGRDAVARMYVLRLQRMPSARAGGIVQGGIAVAGPDTIYEWGSGWLELAPSTPGGQPIRSGGRYLTVWQRGSDGHWHIIRNVSL